MIKKVLLLAALILPMFASAQTLKIAVIDTNQIFTALPETAEAQKTLEEYNQKYENEYKNLMTEMQKQYEDFNAMPENELPAIKERKARELQDTQKKIQDFEQLAMNDLQKKQDELMAPIMQKIRSAIESVGKEGGYSLIQELGSQLYFSAPVEDITPLVKSKLGL